MKKKIFSTLACLMLCFTAMFMVSGCGEKDDKTPIAEEQAMSVMATAMESMQETTKLGITGLYMGMEINAIQIDGVAYAETYSNFMGEEGIDYVKTYAWTEPVIGEDNQYTVYTKTETKLTDVASTFAYEKTTATALSSNIEGMPDLDNLGEFFEAYTKGAETYLVFGTEDEGKIVLIVKDNLIRKIEIKISLITLAEINFTYDDEVTEEIPTRPTNVDWREVTDDNSSLPFPEINQEEVA